MIYSAMLYALVFDKLVWGTTPSALSILGSILILGSAICVAVHKQNNHQPDDVTSPAHFNASDRRGAIHRSNPRRHQHRPSDEERALVEGEGDESDDDLQDLVSGADGASYISPLAKHSLSPEIPPLQDGMPLKTLHHSK